MSISCVITGKGLNQKEAVVDNIFSYYIALDNVKENGKMAKLMPGLSLSKNVNVEMICQNGKMRSKLKYIHCIT